MSIRVESHRGAYEVEFTSIKDLPKVENSIAIVDRRVYELYYRSLRDKFDWIHLLEAVEENKTLSYCVGLIDELRKRGVKKNTTLVAVGGGITQDVTSFTASILYRGISWAFIPTTLLAQADSCIGSKTSINHENTKNLVGSFYPPKKIWCDISLLRSLPLEDIDSGIGEMMHYFLLDGRTETPERHDLLPAIKASLAIKKEVIEQDEFDEGVRRLFNYGHTFGHAIETLSNYKVRHGSAVTLGMHLANYIAFRLGYIGIGRFERLQNLISFNLPDFTVSDVDTYVSYLMKDKKNVGSSLTCILPTGDTSFEVMTISDIDNLTKIIGEYFE